LTNILTVFVCKHHVSSYMVTQILVSFKWRQRNFTLKLHSVIVEEEIKHFNWRDFKIEIGYKIEVSV